jgi:ATP-binding cassette subfamily B (MDR/TAP) protein 1
MASVAPDGSSASPRKVRLCALCRFATCFDKLLMAAGLFCAFLSGGVQCAMLIAFSGSLEALGGTSSEDTSTLLRPMVLLLAYVSIAISCTMWLSYWLVPLSASRQISALRLAFFKAALRQDMQWYDDLGPGALSLLINEHAEDVYTGLSKKLVELVYSSAMFVLGMATAFYYSWQLSLLLLCFVPFMGAAAAAVFALVGGDMEEKRKESYMKAGAVASEALGSVRTVMSFSGEVAMSERYSSHLGEARTRAIALSTKAGAGGALMMTIMFAMYGGGFWFGGTMIADSRKAALTAHPPPTPDYGTPVPVDTNSSWYLQSVIAAEACSRYKDNAEALASCACSISWPTTPQEIPVPGGKADQKITVTYSAPNCGCQWKPSGLDSDEARALYRECVSTGDILTAFFAVITGAFSLGQFGPALQAVGKARSMAADLFEIIDRVPVIDPDEAAADGERERTKLEGSEHAGALSIEFRNVTFAYRKRVAVKDEDTEALSTAADGETADGETADGEATAGDEKGDAKASADGSAAAKTTAPKTIVKTHPVFSSLSFTIRAGETVAFVGESGSGKSTVGKLVARMYDVEQDGAVLINGVDARALDVASLRSRIGIVSQEPLLFDRSISENIRLGSTAPDSVTDAQIKQAAKDANAHGFISSTQFPHGYDTKVGVRGSKLSGGQKQRVAIARGLLRDPSILILDEATSALDTESERIVQEALDRKSRGRTTIIIAHRLSTVRDADRIMVLGEGDQGLGGGTKIREQGTHDELMAKKGIYFALVGSQGEPKGDGTLSTEIVDAADADGVEAKVASSSALRSLSAVSSVHSDGSSKPAGGKLKRSEDAATDTGKNDTLDATTARDKAERKNLYKVSTSRVWKFARGANHFIVLATICAILSGGVWPGLGLVFGDLLTSFSNFDDAGIRHDVMICGIYFFGLAAAQYFIQYGMSWGYAESGELIVERLRSALFRGIMRQDAAFFDDPKHATGQLLSLLGVDCGYVQLVTGNALGSAVALASTTVVGITISFTASWQMSLALLGIVPLIGAANALMNKYMILGETGAMEKLSESATVVGEAMLSQKEIQAFNLRDVVFKEYAVMLNKVTASKKSSAFWTGVGLGAPQIVMLGSYAFAFWYGGYLIDQDALSFDNMFKATFVLMFMSGGMGQAATFAGDAAKASVSTSRVFRVIDRVPTIDSAPWEWDTKDTHSLIDPKERKVQDSGRIASETFAGKIEIAGVNFAYPSRPDAEVFNNMTLTIEAGQSVALVGTSGSGKSTVISLLERFYDPQARVESGDADVGTIEISVENGDDAGASASASTSTSTSSAGAIFLDGRDLKSIDVKWLREQVALVGQEPRLFHGSIYENIAMGKRGATKSDVEEAARAANAHEFIMQCPGGYDYDVGVGGSKLSGGQKQRVAIARAIIRKPKILLLDEATSALDNESEKIVQESLDALLADNKNAGRTMVLIAHRLSTIRNCDKIFVLENDWSEGKGSTVVEQGTHEELMAMGGKYTALRRAFDGDSQ